jgi:hypothetical protein
MATQDENDKEPYEGIESNSYYVKDIQKALDRKELYKKYLAEIKENDSAMDYLKGFSPKSAEAFLENFALKKAYWMHQEYDYAKWNEEESVKWIEEAWRCLFEIQQKKLFDLQCLWRADQIELEGIEICYDFVVWGRDIFNCPHIPNITEDEVDLYIQFLQSPNYVVHIFDIFEDWQSYSELKEAYHTDNVNTNFPEWYDFYNGRKGGTIYLSMPDIRGEKEETYKALWHAAQDKIEKKEAPQEKINEPYQPTTPQLTQQNLDYWNHNHRQWFVETFEDETTRIYYKAHKELSWEHDEIEGYDGNVSDIVTELEKADEMVPVEAYYDYRIALKRALDRFERKKISEALPIVYEQYLMRKEMGLTFDGLEGDSITHMIREQEYESIMGGRKLNGDDWDF